MVLILVIPTRRVVFWPGRYFKIFDFEICNIKAEINYHIETQCIFGDLIVENE